MLDKYFRVINTVIRSLDPVFVSPKSQIAILISVQKELGLKKLTQIG